MSLVSIPHLISVVYGISQEALEEGLREALLTYEELDRLEEAVGQAKEALKAAAIAELEKHGRGEHPVGDSIAKTMGTKGKWDFEAVSGWKEAALAESLAKKKRAGIEDAAKAVFEAKLKNPFMTFVNEGTGEIPTGARYTPGGTTIAISRSKKHST